MDGDLGGGEIDVVEYDASFDACAVISVDGGLTDGGGGGYAPFNGDACVGGGG